MPLEAATKQKEIGSLGSCLVEGDAEQLTRQRRIKRRALAVSLIIQAIVLTVVVLAPLFAKVSPLAAVSFVPIPPYRHAAPERLVARQRQVIERPRICFDCLNLHLQPIGPIRHEEISDPLPEGDPNLGVPGLPTRGINIFDSRPAPPPPPEPKRPRVIHVTRMQPAMLLDRIEPQYPPLMRQLRRSGRVELHALISTDGSIESLQVISGDPGFYQSALDAVQQWRYKPTYLNGQPVEVETVITVIYNIN